jgi:hypothetical protein
MAKEGILTRRIQYFVKNYSVNIAHVLVIFFPLINTFFYFDLFYVTIRLMNNEASVGDDWKKMKHSYLINDFFIYSILVYYKTFLHTHIKTLNLKKSESEKLLTKEMT